MIRSQRITVAESDPRPVGFELTEHAVVLPGLPSELTGLSLVQLSDFHRGNGHIDPLIREAVDQSNRLHPDYVMLTGDFVDKRVRDILPVVQMVSCLRARRGIFAVLGNHDHYADAELLTSALE